MSYEVAVILPCRGRFDQTIAYANRLRAAAGNPVAVGVNGFDFVAVGGFEDDDTLQSLAANGWDVVGSRQPTLTYWEALTVGVANSNAVFFVNVANDLYARDRWLEIGLAAYRARWPEEMPALMGFSGDGHLVGHSCHFLIHRSLIARFGGWPTHYQHNSGDTELCVRAQGLGVYAKATHAVLEHRHPARSTAPDDAVYAAGRATWAQDQALFNARKAAEWI